MSEEVCDILGIPRDKVIHRDHSMALGKKAIREM
jgi:hypothetical protein